MKREGRERGRDEGRERDTELEPREQVQTAEAERFHGRCHHVRGQVHSPLGDDLRRRKRKRKRGGGGGEGGARAAEVRRGAPVPDWRSVRGR